MAAARTTPAAQAQSRLRTEELIEEAEPSRGVSSSRLRTEELIEEAVPSRGVSSGLVLGGMFLFASVVLAIAYFTLGQQGQRNLLHLTMQARTAAPLAPTPKVQRLVGELHVGSEPARAQVFLFVGLGPALATDLPIGVAQEFIALADGYQPARAVVPSDAVWDAQPGQAQPRYELAMQSSKGPTRGDDLPIRVSSGIEVIDLCGNTRI